MKQVHAVLRLLICLLLAVAWAKQPSPVSPEHSAEGSTDTDGRFLQADAEAVPDDVDVSSTKADPRRWPQLLMMR